MKIFISLLVTCLALLARPEAVSQRASRPNIILILADDLAQADLGCYGNPFNKTPQIDLLAKEGIKFTQAYAASPVCSPSRAALMTGRHPARLKLTNFLVGERTDSLSPLRPAQWVKGLSPDEKTLAERLLIAGYRTGFVGKWHLGSQEKQAPWNRGFDYARMITKNGLDYYNYTIAEAGNPKSFADTGQVYLTDKLTDYALEFISKSDRQKPFFLYLSYSAPHVFVVPRADKVSKYLAKYEQFGQKYNPYYAAMIESLDDGVGRVLRLLAERGIDQNTLVVFTSDNGGLGIAELGPVPTTAGNLRKWKGFTYEGGIRVPALVRWPEKIGKQQTCTQYFVNTDYTPTILQMLGLPDQEFPDASSIYPLLNNPQAQFDRGALYWHYPHFSNQQSRPAGAIRSGDWKLVRHYETGNIELFNLRVDEGETSDLSRKYPAKAAELNQKLTAWLEETEASMPIKKSSGQPISP